MTQPVQEHPPLTTETDDDLLTRRKAAIDLLEAEFNKMTKEERQEFLLVLAKDLSQCGLPESTKNDGHVLKELLENSWQENANLKEDLAAEPSLARVHERLRSCGPDQTYRIARLLGAILGLLSSKDTDAAIRGIRDELEERGSTKTFLDAHRFLGNLQQTLEVSSLRAKPSIPYDGARRVFRGNRYKDIVARTRWTGRIPSAEDLADVLLHHSKRAASKEELAEWMGMSVPSSVDTSENPENWALVPFFALFSSKEFGAKSISPDLRILSSRTLPDLGFTLPWKEEGEDLEAHRMKSCLLVKNPEHEVRRIVNDLFSNRGESVWILVDASLDAYKVDRFVELTDVGFVNRRILMKDSPYCLLEISCDPRYAPVLAEFFTDYKVPCSWSSLVSSMDLLGSVSLEEVNDPPWFSSHLAHFGKRGVNSRSGKKARLLTDPHAQNQARWSTLQEGALRSASHQITKILRDSIVHTLPRKDQSRLQGWMNTSLGRSAVGALSGILLGSVTDRMPQKIRGVVGRIATELRVQSAAEVILLLSDTVLEPVKNLLLGFATEEESPPLDEVEIKALSEGTPSFSTPPSGKEPLAEAVSSEEKKG